VGQIKCFACHKEFLRNNSEINRNKRLGRENFCSRKCAGKYLINNIPEYTKYRDCLKKGGSRDEYSPYRFFMKVCKNRANKRKKELNLSLQDLKEQWEKQNGKCPFTGWNMKIAECTGKVGFAKTPDRASLDRIDSSKGYVKGNIQFISLIAQYAKNDWGDSVIFEFANAVSQQNN
jgi:hypothetical protein